jgi:hypothetical protein
VLIVVVVEVQETVIEAAIITSDMDAPAVKTTSTAPKKSSKAQRPRARLHCARAKKVVRNAKLGIIDEGLRPEDWKRRRGVQAFRACLLTRCDGFQVCCVVEPTATGRHLTNNDPDNSRHTLLHFGNDLSTGMPNFLFVDHEV